MTTLKTTPEEQSLFDDFTISIFNRGYEKGKEDATISYKNAYDEGHVDGYTKGLNDRDSEIKKAYNDGYNKGLNDAWECAKMLRHPSYDGALYDNEKKDIFGYISSDEVLTHYTPSEAIAKIKEYEEKQKAPSVAKACSILEDDCPYIIECEECEVHCSIERARKKLKESNQCQ